MTFKADALDFLRNKKDDDDNGLGLVEFPYRILYCGSSASGKTTHCINGILQGLYPFDKLYVYTPTIWQDVYVNLKKIFDDIDNSMKLELITKMNSLKKNEEKNKKEISELSATIKSFTPTAEFSDDVGSFDVSQLDKQYRNLVICDDVMLEKKQSQYISLFSKGRHYNASCIYMSQSYFAVHKVIRANISHLVLYEASKAECSQISRFLPTLETNVLYKMLNHVTKQKYIPLVISFNEHNKYSIDFSNKKLDPKYFENIDV